MKNIKISQKDAFRALRGDLGFCNVRCYTVHLETSKKKVEQLYCRK